MLSGLMSRWTTPCRSRMSHRRQEVVAVPGQHLQGRHAVRAKLGGERLVAGLLQDEDRPAVHDQFFFDGDDELAVERPQGLGLFVEPGVVVLGEGDLEDELLVVLGHQQGGRRRPLAENSIHDEAMFQAVASLGVQGIDDDGFSRGGEFVLHVVEQRQEVLDRADAGEYVGVGTPLDQLFQLRPGPVENGRNAQALLLPQDLGEFGRVGRRWPGGEQVEGDGPEREDIRRFRDLAGVGERLGRHVDEGLGLDQILDVRDPARGGCGFPDADLPVVDLKPGHRRIHVGDEDALRSQRPVDDPLAVGVADGVGDLAQHVEPLAGGQLLAVGRQIVIEADGVRVGVIEQQGRAEFVFLVVRAPAGCRCGPAFWRIWNSRAAARCSRWRSSSEDACATVYWRTRRKTLSKDGMLGEPILIARPISDQVAQHVVADPPRPLRGADAGLLHRPGQGLGDLDVDGGAEVGVDPRPVPVDEGGEDALALGVMLVRRAVLEADPVAGRAGEVALEVVGGQEDQGVEPRHPDLADGGLRLEQRGQRLRLAVGEEDGVVVRVESSVLGAGPCAGVAPDPAFPRLASRRARSPSSSGRGDRPRRWPRRWSGTRNWPTPGTDRGRAGRCG